MSYFNRFFVDDDGAVTVDWVVLTAAIVTLAFAIVFVIRVALMDSSGEIGDTILGVLG